MEKRYDLCILDHPDRNKWHGCQINGTKMEEVLSMRVLSGIGQKTLSLLLILLLLFGITAPAGAVEPKKALQDYFVESLTKDSGDVATAKGQIRFEEISFTFKTNAPRDPFNEAFSQHLNGAVLDYDLGFDMKNRMAYVSLSFSNRLVKLPLNVYIMPDQIVVDLDSVRKLAAQIDPKDAARIPADKKYLVSSPKDKKEMDDFWNNLVKAQKQSTPDAKSREAVIDMIGLFIRALPDQTVREFENQAVGIRLGHNDLVPYLSSLIKIVAENPDKMEKLDKALMERSSLPQKQAAKPKLPDPAEIKKKLEEFRSELDRSFHLHEYTLIKGPRKGNSFRSLNRIDIEMFDIDKKGMTGRFQIELENWDTYDQPLDHAFPSLTNSNQIPFEEFDRRMKAQKAPEKAPKKATQQTTQKAARP
ncbi:hypothetical protein GTO91_08815 [Heliobacterium undosum]|uniref:Uncharacterized protein n=1 Tax=Heliomicrobium undosum TaxID=121734 RepID=A0A845L2B4_9FIRM|nr:hypothetical protein [Heliomicrobium undosum]MZP29806.1 hypothetical protein [Heliomicrobium undosum]